MRFGRTLQSCVYAPWSSKYIDYSKLKELLREDNDVSADTHIPTQEWTEDDEGVFVDELVNVQLEKVNGFHNETYRNLRDRTTDCEVSLQRLSSSATSELDKTPQIAAEANTTDDKLLLDVLQRLDSITKEVNELEKYSRINFTGFLKAAKKHDRRRGSRYRVRPLLQVRLAALPFNSEDYSPLLYQLSAMYSFVRQRMQREQQRPPSESETKEKALHYRSHKFWVHPENLLEVKTYILRRLPVLVYNPQTSKIAEGAQHDPRITSLYFDNPGFSLYTDKVSKKAGASSVRLRWFGHLSSKSEIHLEKKTIEESGDSDEIRIPIKEKYVQDFLTGQYKMEKPLNKLKERQGTDSDAFRRLLSDVDALQSYIKERELQPILRANYTRTAFQIPGDDRVRISLDTDVAFIREDSLDQERPCRDPSNWHRTDIDTDEMEFPFSSVRRGEISRFPYALLEIKIGDGAKRKTHEWVADLMSSHLVKESPRFSKFVHGVAQLFEDHVNSFPFWLSDLETDIRRDPGTAFQEEQAKKAKHVEEEQAVGSFMGSQTGRSFIATVGSPVTKSVETISGTAAAGMGNNGVEISDSDEDENQAEVTTTQNSHGLQSFLPSFSGSRYGRSRQQHAIRLPPGVREPGRLTKQIGPVQVEPKVWLANQRTFVKWQHISVLLATLSLSLYNAAGDNYGIAQGLAIAYTLIATMTGGWGWWTYTTRSRMIRERSGSEFDSVYGPIFVCVALIVALCLNFGLQCQFVFDGSKREQSGHSVGWFSEHFCAGFNTFFKRSLLLCRLQMLFNHFEQLASSLADRSLRFSKFGVLTYLAQRVMECSQSTAAAKCQQPDHLEDLSDTLHVQRGQSRACSYGMLANDARTLLCSCIRSTEDEPSWDPMPSPSVERDRIASGPSVDSATMPIEDPIVWPPRGFTTQAFLAFNEAVSLICCGAILFRSFSVPAQHAVDHHAHLHSFIELSNGSRIREATSPLAMLDDCMSFPLDESLEENTPWNTLEQPSMTLCFGRYPGTMTFSRYISRLNRPAPSTEYTSKTLLRKLDNSQILDRLRLLQELTQFPFAPEEEQDFLYGELLLDPESDIRNGKIERDIDVLSDLLSSQIWIDFSDPREQIVAQHHVNGTCGASAELFFHQLLLSTELARRIDLCATSAGHSSGHLLSALPRKVAWGVSMSRRFFQNLAFEEVQTTLPNDGRRYSLIPQNKYAQMEMVLNVGYELEWPTMPQIEAKMMAESAGRAIQCLQWTMPSLTFLTGTVMPGPVASWMVLSCLLDCSYAYRMDLDGLKELRPQSGFQYLSNTYWYWQSIVGKVLGAMQGSKCVAGWIGPCISTPDLKRVEYVRIHHEQAPERMRKIDTKTVAARSEPLGTLKGSYPVDNFHVVLPYSSTVDCIRVEKLALVPLNNVSARNHSHIVEHKVAVQFAVNGRSIPVRLKFDVSFIAAAACSAGPHVLFYDYAYKQVRIDHLLHIAEWAERFAKKPIGERVSTEKVNGSDIDKVLVIEAYGAADNAVLARAWCAHLGLSAVVADIDRTCLACTIREAYAARVAVAIISDLQQFDDQERVSRASPCFAKGW